MAREALTRARTTLRTPLVCLVATLLAWFILQNGLISRFDNALSDVLTFSDRQSATGRVALIVANARTVAKTGRFPIDRPTLARTLDQLREAGVGRVYIDVALYSPEDPAGDAELARAISRLGRQRVAVSMMRADWINSQEQRLRPLDIFARDAAIVSTDFLADADRRNRRIASGDAALPLSSAWLAGQERRPGEPLLVDFSVRADTLPRHEMSDVAAGAVAADAFRDRLVILGVEASSAVYAAQAPLQGRIGRADAIALGAETLMRGSTLVALPRSAALLLTFGATLLAALMMASVGAWRGLAIVIALAACWIYWLADAQKATGLILPVCLPIVSLLAAWQMLLFRGSALAAGIRRRITRLVGVGREALVAALDVVAEPALVLDPTGRIHAVNECFASGLGVPAKAGVEGALFQSLFADTAAAGAALDARAQRVELALRPQGARERWFEVRLRWVDSLSGPLAIARLHEVTETRARAAHLETLAFRDAMTGLYNRISFEASLKQFADASEPTPFAILLIDLDGFKQVNDTLGHHAGDRVLKDFARRLQSLTRAGDVAARLGGDEFAVLIENGDEAAACGLAERILDSVVEPFDLDGAPARVGASIGVALWPSHHDDASEALKLADAAMYLAKRQKPGYALHTSDGPRLMRSGRRHAA
ncbi:MAG: diguanylate cyclase [Rhodoblastus sp.]|nr:diguanylate cyclase [Rhodoblastus sp.]